MFYITLGAVMTVWSGIWFLYLRNNPPTHAGINYLCMGFLVTGMVLFAIGIALGPLSRWARHAELPPEGTPIVPSNSTAATTQRVI
jgi:RsiW-degrading membrane proteinase PrsW (M82 family)